MKKSLILLSVLCVLTGFDAECSDNKPIQSMKYELIPLEYSSSALEPWLDTRTVDLHHYKHQAAYVDKLNIAMEAEPAFSFQGSVEELISDLGTVPESIRTAVRNNGGGAWNHAFYWRSLSPANLRGEISPELSKAIHRDFGSFENFKAKMTNAAISQFGSGWAWLCVDSDGKLKVLSTPNQDSPVMGEFIGMGGLIPLLTIDVWEHAYYLKYQNRRPEYAESIWNIVNWKRVSERFAHALEHKKTML